MSLQDTSRIEGNKLEAKVKYFGLKFDTRIAGVKLVSLGLPRNCELSKIRFYKLGTTSCDQVWE